MTQTMNEILAKHTGKSLKEVKKATASTTTSARRKASLSACAMKSSVSTR